MEQQADPLIGQTVAGRYRVIKPLGEGGMGQVYLAEHEAIEKKVALKVLRPEYSRKEDIVTRFQQEAISASRIKHPNVLDVFDFGRLDTGETFIAMEFLEGHDLSDELQQGGVVEPSRAMHIVNQICRALAAAHSQGVVHRDMKPDNVFLQKTMDGDEIVKIVDFGIAQLRSKEEATTTETSRRRLTRTGMIFGTPEYMAPEQAAGKPADLRVDVYAVGVILYEMFTNAVPFTGDSFMAILAATLNDPPPPMRQMNPDLAISEELERVVMQTLAKSPDQRYASMADLATALSATPEGSRGRASQLPMPQGSIVPGVAGAPTAALGAAGALGGPPAGESVSAKTAAFGSAAAGSTTSGVAQTGGGDTPAPGPSTGLVLGALGVVIVGGGIGAFALLGRGAAEPAVATEPPAATSAPAPVSAAPPAPPTPSAAPTAESEPEITPQANEVTLHVETQPPGAVLTKDGFQICEATPCDVIVDRKEGVTLDAKKDALEGQAKILALKDQTVTIELAAPVVRAAPRPRPQPKPPAAPRMCEVDVNGLKILRPCP